ncbi:alpha/beta hydrolase [Fulvivirgaceae bacterium BMA12]|uniref:Alpha/beta hydrolase n=1 Tax=Agaribacillus aureus TaxID=3051825 RepID=A0ABT8L192_9BACT|nr:alpha/beta hydrolase [Fulvivirgaceae bacterium BMA12]
MKNFTHILVLLLLVTGCKPKSTHPDRLLNPPKGYMNETFMKISYFLGMLDLIETEPSIPDEIQEIKNIEYKNIDSLSLQLDIYKRKNLSEPAPVMMFIHGGAWRTGKRSDYLPYLIDYAKKGFITVTVSYRLVKQAVFPAAVQDVNCAVKWIKTHGAAYGIDTEKIVLIGGSAGGHLAMMIGYGGDEALFNQACTFEGDSKVSAVINLYGPTDLATPYAISTYQVKDFLNTTFQDDPETYRQASPKTFISADDPPTLIFHGTIDSLVPVSQSDSLSSWLGKAGIPHDYHRLKGWPHTMDLSVKVNEYCQFYIDAFLKKHL